MNGTSVDVSMPHLGHSIDAADRGTDAHHEGSFAVIRALLRSSSTIPTLLELPAPKLAAYPRETVVAEKLQAMVHLGLANSRMKDFFDLHPLN